MDIVTTRQAFLLIKPLCDLLMKSPSVKTATDVGNFIDKLPKSAVQDLLEYILFPTIIHLQGNISLDVKLYLVRIVRTTIERTTISQLKLFSELYMSLVFTIYDAKQPSMLIPLHEELKEIVVQSLRNLFLCASWDIIESFYSRENATKLSQSIYICLSLAKTEKSSSLRIAGIEALMTLAQVHDEFDTNDITLRSQVANIMMLFLPGIVKGLQEVIHGSDVQNHKVTMTAIRALGRIVALVMEDLPQDTPSSLSLSLPQAIKSSADPLGMSLHKEGREGMEKQIKTTTRSGEWLDAAAEKLQGPMRDLMALVRHAHVRVRQELVHSVELLLGKCSHSLKRSFAELIEILIALSEDDDEIVKLSASRALNNLNQIVTDSKMRPLTELLEERFYKLLTKLPRIIRRSDDATQLSYLNQLAGYLRLLGKERLPHILTSVAHLRRLILSLVYVAELECSNITILEENQVRSIEDTAYNAAPWRRFKFIRDVATEKKLALICRLLGDLGDLPTLVDSFFELMTDLIQYRRELTLLLNWILTAAGEPSLSLVKQVIEFYIEPDFWYLSLHIQDDVSLRNVQENVVQSCLLTEGLGLFSVALGAEYQKFLLKTLYLVIERAGSGHNLISLSGVNALDKIAHSQGHEDIADLIRANVDYFSYYVTIKLRRVEKNPGVLNVVSVVMKYSTLDVMPCLKEIVEDALKQLAANFRQSNAFSLLKVLQTFTICIRQLVCRETDENVELQTSTMAERVIQSVIEHCEAKKVMEEIDNEDLGGKPEDILRELEEREANKVPVEPEDEKKDVPSYVSTIESVMKRCLNFLPSKDISKTLLAMQILKDGLFILAPWSEQLLPIVHELWHPLVDRFHDPNVLIINYSWQLLKVLARVSEDFIRTRTLKQISPALAKFLTKSAKDSYKKRPNDAYQFTQMFKLQKLLLSEMGIVAEYLKLREQELWDVLSISEDYLSCLQQPELQNRCVELYKTVAKYNSDVVWVKCFSLWHSRVTPIAEDENFSLKNLKIDEDVRSEFQQNLRIILTYMNDLMTSIIA